MIKVIYDIKVYRQVLRDIIKKDDVVVELGCHVGNSTRIIGDLSPEGTNNIAWTIVQNLLVL